ncbi:MAG: ABC transporter substrate-binding protein [Bacillota bacterium]
MRIGRKATLLLSLLVAASLTLAACGPKQGAGNGADKPQDKPATSEKKPAVGGQVNLALDKEPDSFNPILYSTTFGAEIIQHVYDGLFTFNDNWEPQPHIAESWKVSDDKLTFTIKLKEGVKFSDGAELTAEDVVFTLGTLKDKDYSGPRASSMRDVEAIEATGKYEVTLKLKKPFAPIFTNINYGIMQKKLFESTSIKDMDKNPVSMNPIGTGPYILKEYVRGQYVILERNPNWFASKQYGGAPFIQTIRYKIIPDSQTQLAAMQNGEIDWLNPEPSDVAMLEKDYANKMTAYHWDRNGFGYIQMNNSKAPLDNKLVRQALTYGLNRQSIIDGVMEGRATIPPGPIPPVSWAYDESAKAYPYDPAKAKQLLEQAGYTMGANGIYEKDGKPLKLTFYGSSGSTLIEGIASIARNNWKQIGVDLDVQLMDFNAMSDNFVKPGKFDLSFGGMSLGLDPDSQYNLFHSSTGTPDAKGNVSGFNRSRYSNKQVDEILEAARSEFDPAKRKQLYAEFQKIIVDEAPVIMAYANKYTDFVSNRIKGVRNFPGTGADTAYVYQWYINEQ